MIPHWYFKQTSPNFKQFLPQYNVRTSLHFHRSDGFNLQHILQLVPGISHFPNPYG